MDYNNYDPSPNGSVIVDVDVDVDNYESSPNGRVEDKGNEEEKAKDTNDAQRSKKKAE